MRIREHLYFAPDVKFSELDISGDILPDQFEKRIRGYYIDPAIEAAKAGHAFASGLVWVACIDALAYFQARGSKKGGDRFRIWCEAHLPSFNDDEMSRRFYKDFRNGLVHNARIKNGGEFTLESDCTVEVRESILSINPLHLAKEVSDALNRYIALLKADDDARARFLDRICSDFEYELNN